MAMTLDLPPAAESTFRDLWGDQLETKVLEAMVIEGYRSGSLSTRQVQRLLSLESSWDAEAWLGSRGVSSNYSVDDLESDRTTLSRIAGQP